MTDRPQSSPDPVGPELMESYRLRAASQFGRRAAVPTEAERVPEKAAPQPRYSGTVKYGLGVPCLTPMETIREASEAFAEGGSLKGAFAGGKNDRLGEWASQAADDSVSSRTQRWGSTVR